MTANAEFLDESDIPALLEYIEALEASNLVLHSRIYELRETLRQHDLVATTIIFSKDLPKFT